MRRRVWSAILPSAIMLCIAWVPPVRHLFVDALDTVSSWVSGWFSHSVTNVINESTTTTTSIG
jgi:hypothetical protein